MIQLPVTLNTADVLAALYNAAAPCGMGFLQYKPEPITREQAVELLESSRSGYFDYVLGRPLKVRLRVGASEFDATDYNRYNGHDAAGSVMAILLLSGDVKHPAILEHHRVMTLAAAKYAEQEMKMPIKTPDNDGIFNLSLAGSREVLEPKVNEVLNQNVQKT